MNPKNDDKCFQQQITVALNHKNTKNEVLIIPNVKSFINKCNLKKKKKNCHMEKVRKILNLTTRKTLLIFCLFKMIKKK